MFDTDINDIKVEEKCVLSRWSDKICALTGLDRVGDVKGAYSTLILTLMAHGSSSGISLNKCGNLDILMPTCGDTQSQCSC